MVPRPALSRARMLAASLRIAAGAAIVPGIRTGAAAQALPLLKVGSGNIESNAQVFYALDQGFFKKNGLDAELTILRSGGVTMEAVVSGQLQTGVGNSVSLGAALVRNLPFVVIAPGMYWDARYPNAAIVVAPGSTVKSARDLNGQTLGVTSLGSIDQLAYSAYLDQNGGDNTSIKLVELVPSAMAEAVSQGRVAAGIINDPELSSAVAAGKVRRLVSAYDAIGKLFYGTVWLATRDWLATNKDTARRFADAIVAGGAWAEANRPQAMDVLEKYTKFREDKSIAHYGRKLDPTLLQPVWDAAYRYKLYNGPLRAADYCWDGK